MLPLGTLSKIFLINPSGLTPENLSVPPPKRLNLLRRDSGFTLIELCTVVMVLGVLATTSLLGVQSFREKAMIAKARAEMDPIAKAILFLQSDTGKWPGGQIPGLPVTPGNEITDLNHGRAGLCANDGRFQNWNGPYYARCPCPGPWKNYLFDSDYFIDETPRVAVARQSNKSGAAHMRRQRGQGPSMIILTPLPVQNNFSPNNHFWLIILAVC
jgi:prepilin-type N-terminal cleavage/methylation domain-containing protein